MRDELNEPLGLRPNPPPLSRRLRPVGMWGGRLAVVLLAAGAVALYWRGAFSPPQPQVAVVPFEAVKTVVQTPVAVATPAPATPSVFPAQPGDGVTVVRNGVAEPARGPQIIDVAQALGGHAAPALDRRLLEPTKYGLLPRVAADGARPSEVYARPFAETPLTRGAPRIAVFVGGLGLDSQTTQSAISRLPPGVSVGFAPYGGDLATVAASARGIGHEVWLQAPMEGVDGATPGPHTLKTGASAAENQDSLAWLMGRFTGYVGVANYLGAKFTADADAASPALAEIARRGLLFLDDGSSPLSKTQDLAPGLDLKAARADVIAESGGAEAINAALANVEELARRRGSAIVVSSALPQSLDIVERWASGLEAKGFALVPVSALVAGKPARAARNP